MLGPLLFSTGSTASSCFATNSPAVKFRYPGSSCSTNYSNSAACNWTGANCQCCKSCSWTGI